ncbi:MAG: DUF167 domain-containing protein [Pirellulales bacterium]|nr:DUF167 domain-containing protein [Pirellulales bacterium]
MILLEPHAEGAVLPVRAQPGSRRNEVRGVQDGMLKVCVTQIAEKGKANKAVVGVICDALSLRKSQVELLSGATSQQKRFLVRGMGVDELAARIRRLGPADE